MKLLSALCLCLLNCCRASKRLREPSPADEAAQDAKRIRADEGEVALPVAHWATVPSEILVDIFAYVLEIVPEDNVEWPEEDGVWSVEEPTWLDDLTNFQLVCSAFYASTQTQDFDSFVRENPDTAPDWLLIKRPVVGQQQNIALVRKIHPHLSSFHYSKLIENALDIETVQELSLMSNTASKNIVEPIAPLLSQHHPNEYLVLLLEKMSMTLPCVAEGVKPNNGIPLLFQIKPLNLVKAMALEFPTAFFRLSPSFLFVMHSITSLWRDPAHVPALTELISTLSSIMLTKQQVHSCAMKALILPLILAALSEEREFFEILPAGFWKQQLSLQIACKSNYDLISTLYQFVIGTIPVLSIEIFEAHCWHTVDEHVFGFQGFNARKLEAVTSEYFERPGSWNILLSMLHLKGIGDEPTYGRTCALYYSTLRGNYKLL